MMTKICCNEKWMVKWLAGGLNVVQFLGGDHPYRGMLTSFMGAVHISLSVWVTRNFYVAINLL